jgi:hypothetical protein
MRSPSDLGSMYLLLTFVLWVFFSDLGFVYLLLTWILCVPLLTKVLCIFFWLGSYAFLFWPGFYVSSSDIDPMRSSSELGFIYLLLTFISSDYFCWPGSYAFPLWPWSYGSSSDVDPMRSSSDLGNVYLLLTLILCVPLLTWVLCIFFWLCSNAFLFWHWSNESSSDFDPIRSSSDLRSMYLLLTWILCVPLLTCVLYIFFWLGSSALPFWPWSCESSSDFDPMRSSSELGSSLFFWLWSYAFLFWPWSYESSSDFGSMHSSSDLGPPHAFLYWVLILCVRLLIWVLYLRLMVYYIRSLHLSSACGMFRPSCKIVCFLSKNNYNIHQRIAMVTMTFLMVTHQESWTNIALIEETASHVSIYIQTCPCDLY